MKITKNQRLLIYKQMLVNIRRKHIEWTYRNYHNFCGALWDINSRYDIEDFPELMAYKPKTMYTVRQYRKGILVNRRNTVYWWSPYNFNKRVRILEEIIENMEKS